MQSRHDRGDVGGTAGQHDDVGGMTALQRVGAVRDAGIVVDPDVLGADDSDEGVEETTVSGLGVRGSGSGGHQLQDGPAASVGSGGLKPASMQPRAVERELQLRSSLA